MTEQKEVEYDSYQKRIHLEKLKKDVESWDKLILDPEIDTIMKHVYLHSFWTSHILELLNRESTPSIGFGNISPDIMFINSSPVLKYPKTDFYRKKKADPFQDDKDDPLGLKDGPFQPEVGSVSYSDSNLTMISKALKKYEKPKFYCGHVSPLPFNRQYKMSAHEREIFSTYLVLLIETLKPLNVITFGYARIFEPEQRKCSVVESKSFYQIKYKTPSGHVFWAIKCDILPEIAKKGKSLERFESAIKESMDQSGIKSLESISNTQKRGQGPAKNLFETLSSNMKTVQNAEFELNKKKKTKGTSEWKKEDQKAKIKKIVNYKKGEKKKEITMVHRKDVWETFKKPIKKSKTEKQ